MAQGEAEARWAKEDRKKKETRTGGRLACETRVRGATDGRDKRALEGEQKMKAQLVTLLGTLDPHMAPTTPQVPRLMPRGHIHLLNMATPQ